MQETHFEFSDLEDGSLTLDYRDPQTLDVRMRVENYDIVLHLTRDDVEQILEGFDQ